MAFDEVLIAASPGTVFAVLADPTSYGDWVVGASDIRDADAAWPAPGTRFHHTQWVPHVGLKDTTSVIEVDPPHRLTLEVRARPIMVASVELTLTASGNATRVSMTERPTGGWLNALDGRFLDTIISWRNRLSLRRLRRRCEALPGSATAQA
jgi:uncharacterized protein YndB with AHSA1/START domain